MQPKNAFQRKVVALSPGVKPVSLTQSTWANAQCFDKKGIHTSKRASCLECGSTWTINEAEPSPKVCLCPSCGSRLKMERTRCSKITDAAYFAIITTVSDVQLIRMYLITKRCKVGHAASFEYSEVMQHWIDECGSTAIFSKLVNGFSYAYDAWLHGSTLELRGTHGDSQAMRNGIVPYKIYPKKKIIPAIRRNGFTDKFHGIAPINFFSLILRDSKAETLLKAGQSELLRSYSENKSWIDKVWSSIKICIRNRYIVSDALLWKDYIQLLEGFNCDLKNAHFVCPANLRDAHDHFVRRKRADDKKRLAQAGQEAEREYMKAKQRYFGLCFSSENLIISVIGSVSEVENEGNALNHCVFTNSYHQKEDSLLLSARIEGTPVETIEISLSRLKIIQVRGMNNLPSKYHDSIVALVNKNMGKVRSIYQNSLKQG